MINSFIRITSSLYQLNKAFRKAKLGLIDIKREITLVDYVINREEKLITLKKLQIKLNNFQS